LIGFVFFIKILKKGFKNKKASGKVNWFVIFYIKRKMTQSRIKVDLKFD